MKVLNKSFIGDFMFGTIMRVTRILPEVTPVLRLRGFLVSAFMGACGRNLQITKDVRISGVNNLWVGNDVFMSGGCWVLATERVTLGDGVMLGPYSIIVTGNHSMLDGSYRFGPPKRAPICIKKGAWIAAHAVVCKGVTMGEGSLLSANSVAIRDVDDFSVVAGVPANKVRDVDAGISKGEGGR